jgi:iron complex transport system permease protein
MEPLTSKRLASICGILAAILVLVILLSLKLGAVPVSMLDLATNLGRIIVGQADHLPSEQSLIIREIRLPRILLGLIVGAALSVAGTGFQALLRNPLADSYVLGVSSGASLGAIISLAIPLRMPFGMTLAAFAGALATIAAVYFLGRRGGQLDSHTLLLAGFITASFLSALIMFLMTLLPGGEMRGIAFWLMGDLTSTRTPIGIGWLFALLVIGVGAIYTTAADLNLLLTGEQEAMHLGVDVRRVKLVVYVSASLLVGLAVSVSGAIGYVGFIVPHIMRMLYGSDHRMLIPTSALGGAIAIVIADTIARTLVAPNELPVGAITAIAGAPMFVYLLKKRLA